LVAVRIDSESAKQLLFYVFSGKGVDKVAMGKNVTPVTAHRQLRR